MEPCGRNVRRWCSRASERGEAFSVLARLREMAGGLVQKVRLQRARGANVGGAVSRATVSRATLAVLVLFSSTSCEQVLDEAVASALCISGRRWVGETIGSDEMYPGEDCLDCHRRQDGPSFMAAGTVFGTDQNSGEISQNCYGLEGVRVQLTGADGKVFETTTNRAGNFFFEGSEDLLKMPFRAELRYTTPEGVEANPTMTHRPAYGGCARCHTPEANSTPDVPTLSRDHVRPTEGLFAL
jgi:cytochrome c553